MVFVIPWAILALDVGIPAGMTGAHEGVASFFGENGFLVTGAGSGCDTPPRWREGTYNYVRIRRRRNAITNKEEDGRIRIRKNTNTEEYGYGRI